MKRSLLAAGLLSLVAAVPGMAQQGVERFEATLTGNDAALPVQTNGVGVAKLVVQNGALTYSLEGKSIKGVSAACIHLNVKEGPMVVGLNVGTPGPDSFNASGTVTADQVGLISFDQFLAYLREGKAYISVHTEKHPGGEIQGRVTRVKA